MNSPLVPWNASWSGEATYEIRPCRFAGGKAALWSPHRPGEGKPIFAKPHTVRQRRSIAECRCTVCGERVKSEPWWFGLGDTTVPGFAFVTTEAPVHYDCAMLALEHCPHLRALGVRPEPMPRWDAVLRTIVGGPATEQDFGVSIGRREVIGHLKLAWRRMPRLPNKKSTGDHHE